MPKPKPLPPVVEEARKEERHTEETDCQNCGRKGTLTTRVSCTACGHTHPA